MKKKFFDIKLYAEGLRQTRMMGIILSVATIGLSALIPLTAYFQYWSLDKVAQSAATPRPISIIEMAPVLAFFMYLAPFVLTMMQFGFLNKRRASDFYHSVPNTRTSVFISFSAVVATWLTLVIVLSTVVSALLYSFCPITSISITFIPYTIFTYLAGALLIYAATILAMSITGTGITNFVVTGLILFFPRLMTVVFSQVLNSILLITTSADFGIFADTKYNIPVHFIKSIFGGSSSNFLTSIGAIVYTLILALIYTGIGWILFKRRKSETAEKSAPNKVMQHVYRCLITIPLSLIIPSILVTDGLRNSEATPVMLIVGFLCLIIYYAYELITTKKFSNLLKATPVLLAVIIFDVIFAFSMLLTKQAILSVKPSASEIESVYLNTLSEDQYYQTMSYNQRLLQNVKFTDETLKQLVSDSLKETIGIVEEGNRNFYQVSGSKARRTVTIKTKNNGKITRTILFDTDDYSKIQDIQLKSSEYVEAVSKLPEINGDTNIRFSTLSEEEVMRLWNTYKEEWEGLTVSEKCTLNGIGGGMPYEGKPIAATDSAVTFNDFFTVTGYYGFDEYTSTFAISTLTPKTFDLAVSLCNEENKANIGDFINHLFDSENIYANFNLSRMNIVADNSRFNSIYFNLENGKIPANDFTVEEAEKIVNVVKEALNNKTDLNNLFTLSISYSRNNGDKYNNVFNGANYYITLTEEQETVLNELALKYKSLIKGKESMYIQ